MRRSRRLVVLVAALAATAVVAALVVAAQAAMRPQVVPREGATYYVADADCSNSWSGTTVETPWCDADPLEGQMLRPGNRVLLACGGLWQEPAGLGARPFFTLTGSGTAERPITVGSYVRGSGSSEGCTRKPRLVGGSDRSVIMVVEDPDHFRIEGLELSRGAVGLRVHFTSAGHRDVQISDLVVHDFKGVFQGDCATWPNAYTALGVLFDHTLDTLPNPDDAVLRGIRIEGLEGYHNQGSLGLLGYGCALKTATSTNLYNDVLLRNLHLHDDGGPAPACSDGMQMISASDVRVLDSRFEGEGGCFTPSGTTGVILGEVADVEFVNSVFADTPETKSPDQSGLDFEGHTRRVSIRGSYFGQNAGSGLEFLTISDASNFHTGFLIADNLFANNSRAPLAGTGQGGHIWRAGEVPEPSGTITDNLYSNEIPFTVGRMSEISIERNLGSARTTSSARDWGSAGSPWSAERSDGTGGWTAVDPSARSVTVERFALRTEGCAGCRAARVWTAPVDGVVSVRGIAALVKGGTAAVRIEAGTRVVYAAKVADGADVATAVDGVRVKAGDRLRFVAALPDVADLSWAPSIAYTG